MQQNNKLDAGNLLLKLNLTTQIKKHIHFAFHFVSTVRVHLEGATKSL